MNNKTTGYESAVSMKKLFFRAALIFSAAMLIGSLHILAYDVFYPEVSNLDRGHWLVEGVFALVLSGGFVFYMSRLKNILLERKTAEERLKEQNKRFTDIAENAMGWIWETDTEGRYIYSNNVVEKTLGYKKEEILGKYFYELYLPEEREQLAKRMLDIFALKDAFREFVKRNVHKNGRNVWLSTSGVPIVDRKGVFLGYRGVDIDITGSKEIEERLKKEKDKAQNYLDIVRVIIMLINVDQTVSLINKRGCEILECEEQEIIGKNWFDTYIPKRDRDETKKVFEKLISGETEMYEYFENPVLTNSGSEKVIAWHNTILKDEQGKIIGTLSSGEDITEQKWIIEELRKSEAQFRAIFDDAAIGMALVDREGRLIISNAALQMMLGYDGEQLSSMRFIEFAYPDDGTSELPLYNDMIDGKYDNYMINKRFLRKDQKPGWGRFTNSLLRDADGKPQFTICMVENITERKQAEEERVKLEAQLRHSQKMEAIGTLAGGIAHDFNNILTAIMGYGSLLKMEIQENEKSRAYLDAILSSSLRAANLTQSLLAFSRKQIINLKPVSLNEIVSRVEKFLLRIIGEDIEFSTALTGESITVMADSGQIEQALINLANNARDAMPDGGVLTIVTEILELGDEFLKTRGYGKKGTYALISLTDTGIGMDDKTKERIFEPFFTTKALGRGTGLGLSIVYGIIKQHSGYIGVNSELGKGTTFKIYLPITKSEVEKERQEEYLNPVGGKETVLVAEDEAEVREVTSTVLEKFGYNVLEAVDGEDAINKFMAYKDMIQLLMVDVIMPKKNGREVYEEIKKTKPNIKVLFTSGYHADLINNKGLLEAGINFIPKPISAAELLRSVRDALDK